MPLRVDAPELYPGGIAEKSGKDLNKAKKYI